MIDTYNPFDRKALPFRNALSPFANVGVLILKRELQKDTNT